MRKMAVAAAAIMLSSGAAMAGPPGYGYGGDDYCPTDAGYAAGYGGANYGYVEPATYGYGYGRGYGYGYGRGYGYGGYYRPRYYGGYGGGYGGYRGYGGHRGYGYGGGYGRRY